MIRDCKTASARLASNGVTGPLREVEVVATEALLEEDSFLAAVRKVSKPRPQRPKEYVRTLDQHLYGGTKFS
jgi:hypothetical protein